MKGWCNWPRPQGKQQSFEQKFGSFCLLIYLDSMLSATVLHANGPGENK